MTLPAFLAMAALGAVAAIWIGYPLLVWTVARFVPGRALARRPPAHAPMVSVILATRERADVIRARVANLLLTDYPGNRLEVVVALDAGGALSSVTELQDLDERVRVIAGDAPGGKAAALNAGVRAARGDLLVMADAGQRYDARTIPELVAALEDHRFGAVSGALELGGSGTERSPVHLYWRMEKWLRHNEARIHSSVGVTGAVYATRRVLWPVVPASALLDDVYVPMALVLAGHRVGFVYEARAWDVRVFDSANEGVRKTRTLTGVMQLRHLLPDVLTLRNPIVVQFVAHKLLRLLTPALAALFAISALIAVVQALFAATLLQRVTVAGAVLVLFVLPPTRRRILALVRWAVSLQMATTRAVVNGVGGRWSVWARTRS